MQPAAQSPDRIAMLFGASVTFVSHAVLFALLIIAAYRPVPEVEEPELLPVVSAELLMLGDVMPEDGELPWIANPEQAPQVDNNPEPAPVPEEETSLPDQETVVLNPEPVPTPPEPRREENRAQQEETNRDAPERRDRGETNENRPTNDRARMGSQDGVAGGTSLSATAMRNQFAGLVGQLSRALRRPSGITDSEFRGLEAMVYVRCTEAGRITSWDFVERSGNQLFDDAVQSMLNRFRMGSDRLRLSTVTNDDLRNSMIRDGFRIPVTGN